jgi:hypothetical protein
MGHLYALTCENFLIACPHRAAMASRLRVCRDYLFRRRAETGLFYFILFYFILTLQGHTPHGDRPCRHGVLVRKVIKNKKQNTQKNKTK